MHRHPGVVGKCMVVGVVRGWKDTGHVTNAKDPHKRFTISGTGIPHKVPNVADDVVPRKVAGVDFLIQRFRRRGFADGRHRADEADSTTTTVPIGCIIAVCFFLVFWWY